MSQPKTLNISNIVQLDGCDTISNSSDLSDLSKNSINLSDHDDSFLSEYDTEDEVDIDLPRVVLGDPQNINHDPVIQVSDAQDIPTLPLFLVLNARSIRPKVNNLKTTIQTIRPDIVIISETWETKTMDIPKMLQSNDLNSVSFVRNRDNPSFLSQTGGGTAIIYSESKFHVTSADIKPPLGV